MSCIRYLPGTPKSLEHYRERVIEKYGVSEFVDARVDDGVYIYRYMVLYLLVHTYQYIHTHS